jgi:hypothetical protein
MAGGTVPAGQGNWSGTLTANTVDTITFVDRYNWITVNAGNVAANALVYITTDGSTPVTTGGASTGTSTDGAHVIAVANGLPMWFPSSNVIQQGAIQIGNQAAYNASTNPSSPSEPATVTPMESLAGQMANPGTVIKLITTGTGTTYTVTGAG